MSGDFLSNRMLDVEINKARQEDKDFFHTAEKFDKQLQKEFKSDEERKQKINLNGKWFEK